MGIFWCGDEFGNSRYITQNPLNFFFDSSPLVFDRKWNVGGAGPASQPLQMGKLATGSRGVGFWRRVEKQLNKQKLSVNFQPTDLWRTNLCVCLPSWSSNKGAQQTIHPFNVHIWWQQTKLFCVWHGNRRTNHFPLLPFLPVIYTR